MATVQCVVLEREADALDTAPYPGELGQRILENVSKEGWTQWLERLVLIINENQLVSSLARATSGTCHKDLDLKRN